ncbi:hypothetical protein R3P38DRAFT_2804231 [Favolaschia claudopus]|uniref:Uncharacterized protein n=1 Tax=Favolaschia claudopus TaxID=2862362 RepID=A0AAV9ZR00_9AGAR
MPATTSRLRPLLPKTPSMTQPEPFFLSRTMEREGNHGELSAVSGAPVEIRANPVSRKSRNQSESERRSAGQKRRRKREAKEKENDGRLCMFSIVKAVFYLAICRREQGTSRTDDLTYQVRYQSEEWTRSRYMPKTREDAMDAAEFDEISVTRAIVLRFAPFELEDVSIAYPEIPMLSETRGKQV